jgi:hypothetical protein
MFINEDIKKIFVKDFSLPISIFKEDHFLYAINKLNPYYNSLKKYELLISYFEKLNKTINKPEEYFQLINKKNIDDVINFIKLNKAYNDFISMDMNKFKSDFNVPKNNQLYKSHNHNKTFISVDLIKANFQCLKFINPEIVGHFNSYNDLISNFTEFDYHIQSKKIRQVIFGNLNPKRQATVQKYIMSLLINELTDQGLEKENILNCTSDELIFEYKPEYENILNKLVKKDIMPKIDFHVDKFKLYKFDIDKPFYYKENNGKITFKGIPNHSILECIKQLENKEIEKKDLQFMFEGRICEFSNSIFN